MRHRWSVAAALLVVISAGALSALTAAMVIPSAIRDPLWAFVQPGVTVWWFAFGALFRTIPSSPGGIAFAAIANAALWLVTGFVATAAVRRVARALGARRS